MLYLRTVVLELLVRYTKLRKYLSVDNGIIAVIVVIVGLLSFGVIKKYFFKKTNNKHMLTDGGSLDANRTSPTSQSSNGVTKSKILPGQASAQIQADQLRDRSLLMKHLKPDNVDSTLRRLPVSMKLPRDYSYRAFEYQQRAKIIEGHNKRNNSYIYIISTEGRPTKDDLALLRREVLGDIRKYERIKLKKPVTLSGYKTQFYYKPTKNTTHYLAWIKGKVSKRQILLSIEMPKKNEAELEQIALQVVNSLKLQ
jgi:hypothetical protein